MEKSKSVSVTLGKGSLNHNNRVFSTENVDPALTKNNVILVRQSLKDAYAEIFGKALEDYNQKQKRNDRKISDYLEHIRHSKNGEKEFHEIVAQVGDRYDTGIKTDDAPLAKEILTQYYKEFILRNPNMRVFNAVIHMDEKDGTPHLHLDFIPVATGQKRGLEIRNSMRQALQQQGYDFQPTRSQSDNPELFITYGKQISKIGGGRWLYAERKAMGEILPRYGIEWKDQGIRRNHMTIKDYKACVETINKEIKHMSPTKLNIREPTLPMKIAGLKDDEIIVKRSSVEAIQCENSALRVQAEIDQAAIKKMDSEKQIGDGFVQRALKEADSKQHKAQRDIQIAFRQAAELKLYYSQGTAEKYKELARKFNQLLTLSQKLNNQYDILAQEKKQIEDSIPERVKQAVITATDALRTENAQLRRMVESLKTDIKCGKNKIESLCQTLHDVISAILTLKYRYKDKSPNPCKSQLTERASYLIDALERESRAALHDAGHPELEKGLDSMGLSKCIEKDINNHIPRERIKEYEIGD